MTHETMLTQRYRAKLLALGLCPICRHEHDSDSFRCTRCRESRRDKVLMRLMSGRCTRCNAQKAVGRYRQCEHCRLQHRVYMRDYLAKHPERRSQYNTLFVSQSAMAEWQWAKLTGEDRGGGRRRSA